MAECRNLKVTPHVAQNLERPGGSAIDARTTHHAGYAISQRKRKRVEECFGWLKTIALLRKVRHHEIFKVGWIFTFAAAAYNLVRMRNLAIQVKPGSKCVRSTGRLVPQPGARAAKLFLESQDRETERGLSRIIHFSAAC